MIGEFYLHFWVVSFGNKYANYILQIHIGRSASSQLEDVMEIGDLNHDEAIDFLCNKRAISKSVAEDIYSLVEGRVCLLISVVNKINSRLNFDSFFPIQYLK